MKLKNFFKPKRVYPPILPGLKNWPVVQLSKNRKQFVEEVTQETVEKVKEIAPTHQELIEDLETTLYREKMRIKRNPWRVDPPDENAFWENVKHRLVDLSPENNGNNGRIEDEILKDIIYRYASEIAGNFKKSSYKFARTFVTFFFARLLNAFNVQGFGSIFSTRLGLQDRIVVKGEIEQIRELAKKGTIVMVPTHFSNLDSVLIGWVIHFLGLPAFIYGAGLNLFNVRIFAYFMNSLGAYKVDRRKKNLPYLETLKTYSSKAIQSGCHSLFFPGGTRSRSGKLEERLKLGLLSTALEAQRVLLEKNNKDGPQKVFVVPVVINYHFVLEAPLLIKQYLQIKGQERFYLEHDEYTTSYKIIKFMIKFFTRGSSMSVSIGRALDLFGNFVNLEGDSLSKSGEVINIKDYFITEGKITIDQQREGEYTRRLSKVVINEFHRISRVFSSHLVGFVAFEILRKKYKNLDLYNLLRLPEEELIIPYEEFVNTCDVLRNAIFKLKDEDKIDHADHMVGDIEEIIKHGLRHIGMYHAKRPLLRIKNRGITTHDLTTLYYYRNRLHGYGLENSIG